MLGVANKIAFSLGLNKLGSEETDPSSAGTPMGSSQLALYRYPLLVDREIGRRVWLQLVILTLSTKVLSLLAEPDDWFTSWMRTGFLLWSTATTTPSATRSTSQRCLQISTTSISVMIDR